MIKYRTSSSSPRNTGFTKQFPSTGQPASTRNFTRSKQSFSVTAQLIALRPRLVSALTSAPAAKRIFTNSRLPICAASINAVMFRSPSPSLPDLAFTSAPEDKRSFTVVGCFPMHARIKGFQPPHCPLLTSAPSSIRSFTTLLAPDALASCSSSNDWPSSSRTLLSTSNRPLWIKEAIVTSSSFWIAVETSCCSDLVSGFIIWRTGFIAGHRILTTTGITPLKSALAPINLFVTYHSALFVMLPRLRSLRPTINMANLIFVCFLAYLTMAFKRKRVSPGY